MNYNSVATLLQPYSNFSAYNDLTAMTLGDWLRQHRKNKGLTQKQVADRAGVSFSYVSTLERQQAHSITAKAVQPRRDSVEALAKAVGGDVDVALKLAGFASKSAGEKESAEFLFKFGAGLIGYDELTDLQKELVKETAQHLINTLRRAEKTADEQLTSNSITYIPLDKKKLSEVQDDETQKPKQRKTG